MLLVAGPGDRDVEHVRVVQELEAGGVGVRVDHEREKHHVPLLALEGMGGSHEQIVLAEDLQREAVLEQ